MKIGVDLAKYDDTLLKTSDGSYLYKSDDGKFDINRFNRDYDQYKKKRKTQMEETLALKLAQYNKPSQEIPIYKQSFGFILINMKNAIFDILDDLLQNKLNINTFTTNNRLFYLGLFFIIIACIIFLFHMIV